MVKIFKSLILVAIILAPIYYFRADFAGAWQKAERTLFIRPCSAPLTYDAGTIDQGFGFSREDFLAAISDAEKLWEESSGRDLFRYQEQGKMPIHLVYDYRQDTTEKLSLLGDAIEDERGEFEKLKSDYESLASVYASTAGDLDAAIAAFNEKAAVYEKEVKRYSQKGGAPAAVYEELEARRLALNDELSSIRERQSVANTLVSRVNDTAVSLNAMIEDLNLDVAHYNAIGRKLPAEYEQGIFTGSLDGGEIFIFQFSDRGNLVRVLAHELGHALGIEHIDDPEDIMYGLNVGENDKVSPADLAALEAICTAPYGLERMWLDLKSYLDEKI